MAYELARELGVPLDVFIVRKLGMPGSEELAMGAITPEDFRAVGQFYEDFSQTTDEEVCELLARAASGDTAP